MHATRVVRTVTVLQLYSTPGNLIVLYTSTFNVRVTYSTANPAALLTHFKFRLSFDISVAFMLVDNIEVTKIALCILQC